MGSRGEAPGAGGLGALLAVLALLCMPRLALAHAEVSPENVEPGSTQTFTVNVVTEKNVPTTEVSVDIPAGFEVTDVRSPGGGWRGSQENGSIVWSGGEIGVGTGEITSPTGEPIVMGEAEDFVFEARVPERTGVYAIDTIQTYKDGSVAQWTGAGDSETPAPSVAVGTDASGGDGHGHDEGTTEAGGADGASGEVSSGDAPSLTPTYIMAGFGVLAAVAVVATLALLRRRPVTEPARPVSARPETTATRPATPYKSPRRNKPRRRNR